MLQNKTWIVLAHKKEIPGIDKLIKKNNIFIIGVGIYESFFNFTRLLLKNKLKPNRVILLGTAGSINKSDIDEIGITSKFEYPNEKDIEIPEFINKEWECKPAIKINLKIEDLIAFSSFGITKRVTKYQFTNKNKYKYWENMEASTIGYICRKENIPFSAILYCTNILNKNARSDWKKNYEKAGKKLKEILIENLLT
ncbi:MAG: hypothetical protein OEZ22_00520 [Spirochaetia bacterium]|nr:hypothetical protein [Spirochaetia bacterium]